MATLNAENERINAQIAWKSVEFHFQNKLVSFRFQWLMTRKLNTIIINIASGSNTKYVLYGTFGSYATMPDRGTAIKD